MATHPVVTLLAFKRIPVHVNSDDKLASVLQKLVAFLVQEANTHPDYFPVTYRGVILRNLSSGIAYRQESSEGGVVVPIPEWDNTEQKSLAELGITNAGDEQWQVDINFRCNSRCGGPALHLLETLFKQQKIDLSHQ
jgi:hypothetical protein